jgi:predicted membrane protein DUF2306
MTRSTVPHTRPAAQRRPGVRDGSSWRVPVALVVRRHPRWHRRSGRILVVAGLLVAGSGLWMTLFYPGAPGGDLLWGIRLVVGSAMAASIVAGFTAIRRRDITAHRAWMIRAYALALGAGTQVFTQGIGNAVFGTSALTTDLSLGAGWAINLAVAEYVIRRSRHRLGSGGASRVALKAEVGSP